MNTIYNGEWIDASMQIGFNNRAFAYGDGLFETMIAKDGVVKLLPYHQERLLEGLQKLRIHPPDIQLAASISQLWAIEHHPPFMKVKVYCWRQDGGTYAPLSDVCEYLIVATKIEPLSLKAVSKVGYAESVCNTFHGNSGMKSLNAQSYVMAGIEKNDRGLEDIIICDRAGYVSECLVSNLFWVRGNEIFTPSLDTGCINGVSRRHLIETFLSYGTTVQEVLCTRDELLKADHVLATNAAGVQHILGIDGRDYPPFHAIEMIYQPY